MKNLSYYLVFIVLWLFSCVQSRNEPPSYTIAGTVTDAQTQAPVPGVEVYVLYAIYDASCLFGYCGQQVLVRDTTDETGTFHLFYQVESETDNQLNVNLKIGSLPAGYQRAGSINGVRVDCLADTSSVIVDNAGLEDGTTYALTIFPLTYARFEKPVIPAGWENDTLFLSVADLRSWGQYNMACSTEKSEFTFVLHDNTAWSDLNLVRTLAYGNILSMQYTIRNNGVKKSGQWMQVCTLGDTTAVPLVLW